MRKWMMAMAAVFLVACASERKTTYGFASDTAAPAQTQSAAAAASSTEVGATMPAYEAKNLDGTNFDLASERGNVVLLNLWATWCGPCRFEIPELESLHQRHSPHGFKVIGVSLDTPTNEDPDFKFVKDFIAESKMTYPVVLDPAGRLAELFQTSVIPTTALIDRNGKIVWKRIGIVEPNDTELEKAIADALAQKRS